MGNATVSSIKAASVTLQTWQKEPEQNSVFCHFEQGSGHKDCNNSKLRPKIKDLFR